MFRYYFYLKNKVMRVVKHFLFLIIFLSAMNANGQSTTAFSEPPAWSKEVIWYQIFVERFNNGDKANDPAPANIDIAPLNVHAPTGWAVTPWTNNWFSQEDWEKIPGQQFKDVLQYRRYGGDLQGVINKLNYLQELGVTALFINPINDAPSMHKYDARNYHHVDVNFGPDPIGDNRIIASENPADPATWKWTSADKLFLKLVDEVHKRKMKIIMDYSWNHTGTTFWAWLDILKNQQASKYKDWYDIKSFDDPSTPENEFSYEGWIGVKSLPELKKVNITTPKKSGHPYEGNIEAAAKAHIFSITKRWLAPDGNVTKGIDGYRLDVADQIGLGFWRDFRKQVRAIQPNAYLVGEIWWVAWPDKLMNPAPYTQGDVFDAVMLYQAYRPALYFFSKNEMSTNAQVFKDSLQFQWNRLRRTNKYAMMNVATSHDTPRLLSDFYNTNPYKYKASPSDDPSYKTGRPDNETYERLHLYLIHTFTSVGAPHIWNGEEMGMWGADDPFPRKPLMWKEFTFQPESRNNFQLGSTEYDPIAFNQAHFDFYKKLIAIRKSNPVLVSGEIEFIQSEGKHLGYRRFDGKNEVITLFNLDEKPFTFALPSKVVYVDLLTDKKSITRNVILQSMEAAILKRVK
jgi:cyclomaltodextrinase / maltogenic alpha-amylase / neopullulanase